MATGSLLVVDDDRNLLEVIRIRLESSGFTVHTAADGTRALELLASEAIDLAVLDLQLVGEDGISLMTEAKRVCPGLPVIILTAHGTIESAVEAMRRGAYTYLTKPFDARQLVLSIERSLENRRLTSEVSRLKELVRERYEFEGIVARSEKMQVLLEAAARIAKTDSTVYIHGESGTGKELIARAIHVAGNRRDKPFVAVNCAAIPESLLESELFGHEKGAFTGAVRSSKGLFVQAHQGTIFLDEIGDMPLSIQAKFLRVLQERQFFPLGGEKPVTVDVRVVVATNKVLEEEVRRNRFREDLYYRIRVIPLELPPLRARKEDIPQLAEHFLRKFGAAMGKDVAAIAPQAMRKLLLHDWPGNVRELENTIEYAVAMTRQTVITDDLVLPGKTASPAEQIKPLRDARNDFEKNYLIELLELTRGNVSRAAELAGKYRADFYQLLRKYVISPLDFKNKQ